MKGIPSSGIKKKNNEVLETYKELYGGKEIEFDMLTDGNITFDYNKDYSVCSKTKYTRKVKFV